MTLQTDLRHAAKAEGIASLEALDFRLSRIAEENFHGIVAYVDALREAAPDAATERTALKHWVLANRGKVLHTLQVRTSGKVWAPGPRTLRQVRSGDFQLDGSWTGLAGQRVIGQTESAVMFYDLDSELLTALIKGDEVDRAWERSLV